MVLVSIGALSSAAVYFLVDWRQSAKTTTTSRVKVLSTALAWLHHPAIY
jgi:hypothetical protein